MSWITAIMMPDTTKTLRNPETGKERIVRVSGSVLRTKVDWDGQGYIESTLYNLHNYLMSMDRRKEFVGVEIEAFVANGNLVKVSKIYPQKGGRKVYCCFRKDGASKRLLVTGCKRLREFQLVGQDMFKRSKVPLLVVVNEQRQFEALNLRP